MSIYFLCVIMSMYIIKSILCSIDPFDAHFVLCICKTRLSEFRLYLSRTPVLLIDRILCFAFVRHAYPNSGLIDQGLHYY